MAADHSTDQFDRFLRESISAACAEWGWPQPTAAYYAELGARLAPRAPRYHRLWSCRRADPLKWTCPLQTGATIR